MKNTRTREEIIKSIQEKAKKNPHYRRMLLDEAEKALNKKKSEDK